MPTDPIPEEPAMTDIQPATGTLTGYSDRINHALAFAYSSPDNTFVAPASKSDWRPRTWAASVTNS
mgnify:CR=1 FL=1